MIESDGLASVAIYSIIGMLAHFAFQCKHVQQYYSRDLFRLLDCAQWCSLQVRLHFRAHKYLQVLGLCDVFVSIYGEASS